MTRAAYFRHAYPRAASSRSSFQRGGPAFDLVDDSGVASTDAERAGLAIDAARGTTADPERRVLVRPRAHRAARGGDDAALPNRTYTLGHGDGRTRVVRLCVFARAHGN